MHWGFLFIWIIGAWLVWALLQDNRICFGSAQLSDEAFEKMPFRGIGIMDDDQRAALVGYLLMRPVVERIELCSQVQSQGRIRFLDYADVGHWSNPCRPEWCRRLVLGQRRPSRTGIRPHESFPRPC